MISTVLISSNIKSADARIRRGEHQTSDIKHPFISFTLRPRDRSQSGGYSLSIAVQPFRIALVAEHFDKSNKCTAAIIHYGVLLFTGPIHNANWLYASYSCEPMKSQKARRRGVLLSDEGGSTLLLLPALNKDRAISHNGLDILESCA
jgi:hypothetical protein